MVFIKTMKIWKQLLKDSNSKTFKTDLRSNMPQPYIKKKMFWSRHISLRCLTLVQMGPWYDISLGHFHIVRIWMCLLSMQSPWLADVISPGYNTDKAWQTSPSRHNRVKLVHRNDWHIMTQTNAKYSTLIQFHSRKTIWKYCMQNSSHFVSASLC